MIQLSRQPSCAGTVRTRTWLQQKKKIKINSYRLLLASHDRYTYHNRGFIERKMPNRSDSRSCQWRLIIIVDSLCSVYEYSCSNSSNYTSHQYIERFLFCVKSSWHLAFIDATRNETWRALHCRWVGLKCRFKSFRVDPTDDSVNETFKCVY